jgi:predicted glycoside hydrolase/deacetylase ChbG (UPF0249 family)
MREPGSTPSGRYLIVNADDFGRSEGVNRGIVRAHQNGIVTSASVMVRWPAAIEAGAYGRSHPELSLGLHADLCEWAYANHEWIPVYEVVPMDDLAAVKTELQRQLDLFHAIAGAAPTHIDSHQHCHLREPLRSIFVEAAERLNVPLRGCTPAISYCGDFYGQTTTGFPYPEGIAPASLVQSISSLPPGITEFGCHPGNDESLDNMYRDERAREVETLCDRSVREAISAHEVRLISFRAAVAELVGA